LTVKEELEKAIGERDLALARAADLKVVVNQTYALYQSAVADAGKAIGERDEAQAVAQESIDALRNSDRWQMVEHLLEKHPWLQEREE